MDNQSYLNQITADTKPVKAKNSDSLLHSPAIKILIIGVLATILIIIFGSILGNLSGSSLEKTKQLDLRMVNLTETIETYNPEVKSSTLRSIGVSLKSELKNTHAQLTTYLSSEHDYDTGKPDESLSASEQTYIDALNAELEEARLNAILDRIYASKLSLQITTLAALESEIYNDTTDETLKSILTTSFDSLTSLATSLENYSNS